MIRLEGGIKLSILRIFAILSLIGLVIFWFLTLLAIPMSSEPYAVFTGQYPLFLWIVFMSLFTGASAILSLIIIIQLAKKIEALEILKRQPITLPPEPKEE